MSRRFALQGNGALVTGGSRGIGLDIARGFGSAGFAVTISSRASMRWPPRRRSSDLSTPEAAAPSPQRSVRHRAYWLATPERRSARRSRSFRMTAWDKLRDTNVMAAFHRTVGLLLGCARPRPRKPRSGRRTLGPSRASDRRLISHLHGRQRATPLHRRPVAARYLLRASSVAAGTSPLARRSQIPLQSSGAEFGSAGFARCVPAHLPCPGSAALAPAPTRQNRRSSPIEGSAPGLRLGLGVTPRGTARHEIGP